MKFIKRIKENINELEYKKLIRFIKGDERLRSNTKLNLLRTFTLLYYCGLRINEVQKLTIKDIKELLQNYQVKIILSKTNSERKLYLSDDFKKDLNNLFDFNIENNDNLIITKGSNDSKRQGINPIVFIQQINKIIKEVLGSGFTSHSFRQGLITQMGTSGINVKIISNFIGHKNINTTMGYIKPTDNDIINSMVR